MNDGLIPEPTHYPMDMKRFGLNPYGEPVYRLVYAPSVRMIVGGEFPDGHIGYRTRPAYRHVGDHWILEKWISAFDHTGMTEHAYNLHFMNQNGVIITGPYPSRGTYNHCETLAGNPGYGGIEKLVSLIEKAKTNDPIKNAQSIAESMERKERTEAAERFDRCKEVLPAFGIRAANLGGHVKATKSAPLMKSANELRLPVKQGPSILGGNNAV